MTRVDMGTPSFVSLYERRRCSGLVERSLVRDATIEIRRTVRARNGMRRALSAFGVVLALAQPAWPRAVRLRFPRLHVAAATNPEACVAVRVPTTGPLDVASVRIVLHGIGRGIAAQHFLVYAYTGGDPDGFADAGTPVQSRGCLDFGPPDRDRRQLIASGVERRSESAILPGGVLRLAPAAGTTALAFVLDGEWVNGGPRSRTVSAVVTLRRPRSRSTGPVATLFSDDSAEARLDVSPGTIASSDPAAAAWGPGRASVPSADVCVLQLTGQMHKRGRFLAAVVVDADGHVVSADGPLENPFAPGSRPLFAGLDWTDMGAITRPFRLAVGDAIEWACWADNGVARPVRLGCEETAGVPPGAPGAPAKRCAGDADCPPRDEAFPGRTFTGACVPANLVAGTDVDDEVCRLDGVWVAAGPATPCATP
jgi:hypothetical protein